ncbi:DUF6352 family protein [Polynucleobacter sp. IMCC 30228]|uniref:DUF6352 family protein n=1 Tax=Polynucleobacter sp. IMCC 30228 TaxID=2781011 RepID=UPI001F2EDBD0|nr:DUF6352 family protein [Polynucleobacter sp. IMCC 30228]
MNAPINYWPQCAYKTLQVSADNQLLVTDDFLRTYLLRDELNLVPESCAVEKLLHQRLTQNPRTAVSETEIAEMMDSDIQENYRIWLRYRTKLLTASSLESFYLGLFAGDGVDVPPLFVNQLVQIFMRHILGDKPSAMDARVAELFFRSQKMTVLEDGLVMSADHETIERNAQAPEFANIVDLLKQTTVAMKSIDLDVLHEDNVDLYWTRESNYDFAIPLNFGQTAVEHFSKLLAQWLNHFLGIEVKITPLAAINDPQWVWHVGLDAASTEILNALYNKDMVEANSIARLICLFRLDFISPNVALPELTGKPVYLGMAMNHDKLLKLKPQNLLFNLPLAPMS